MFPQYLKLSEICYIKIISNQEFEELKIIGKKYSLIIVEAKQLPERNYIQDIIKSATRISKDVYQLKIMDCELQLQKLDF